MHKGQSYPGEHVAIVSRDLWDRVHSILATSPRQRAGASRRQTPALLKGIIFAPNGSAMSPTLQAFEWKRMLDDGKHDTISDLAGAARLNHSSVSRVLRLTLLAPDLVEAILDGRQTEVAQRQRLLHSLPDVWHEQMKWGLY